MLKVDLNCPIEPVSVELPEPDGTDALLVFFNLTEKRVTSVQAKLVLWDEQDEPAGSVIERVIVKDGGAKSEFKVVIDLSASAVPASAEVVVEKVWFDDNVIWRRGSEPPFLYDPIPVPDDTERETLAFLAGNDAFCYPRIEGNAWICVCGRANAGGEPVCPRCERTQAIVFGSYTEEIIKAIVRQHALEAEDLARKERRLAEIRQAELEANRRKKRKRVRAVMILFAVLVFLAGSAYGVFWHLLPFLDYRDADQLYASCAYEEAKQAFTRLLPYRDTAERVLACDYAAALALMEQNTEDTYKAAEALLTALGDYKDARSLARDAVYKRAGIRMQAEDYPDAAALYDLLGEYGDAADLARSARLFSVKALMTQSAFEEAKRILTEMDRDEEVDLLLCECDYLPAKAALSQKNYDTAIPLLTALGDYSDAEELLKETYYHMAESFGRMGENLKAAETYLLAGDYEDAAAKAAKGLFDYAETLMAKRDYEQAHTLFSQIDNDIRAQEKARECAYWAGVTLMQTAQYDEAERYFALTIGYMDTSDRLAGIAYARALILLESGQPDEARAAFEALEGYADSAQMALEAIYRKAESKLEATAYDESATLFLELGAYRDARARAEQTILTHARIYFDEGDFEGALTALERLTASQDAAHMRLECRYAIAVQTFDAADYALAEERLSALGDYQDAQALLSECRYHMAEALMQAGEPLAAAAIYELCGDYADAALKAEDLYTAYYDAVSLQIREAFDAGEYDLVISLALSVNLDSVPDAYQTMLDCFYEASYILADDYYNRGFPYLALPYYTHIPHYKDVQERVMTRNAYRIIGYWQGGDAPNMVFYGDGTCIIGDETFFFNIINFSLSMGAEADNLDSMYTIRILTSDELVLSGQFNGNDVTYRMRRAEALNDETAGR